jgi:hypothetical protein
VIPKSNSRAFLKAFSTLARVEVLVRFYAVHAGLSINRRVGRKNDE